MNKNSKSNYRGKGKGFKPTSHQGKKDSSSPRINADNARIDKVEDAIEADSKKESANDISYYNKNPELLKAASSISYYSIVGDRLGDTNNTVPGIMTMLWMPSFGAETAPLAWNKSWQQIFSYIVHANSRNYSQDFTDYALFSHAGFEIFVAIEEAKRAYGVMKAYTEPNYYYVDSVVRMLGFDPVDLRRNLSRMWFDINDLIVSTKDIWVPNIMPILNRYLDLAQFIYSDADGAKAQTYAFVRRRFFMLSETGSSAGTALVPALIPVTNEVGSENYKKWKVCDRATYDEVNTYTWDQYYRMVKNMITVLMASQDRGIIYGNIMNAYGTDKLFAMAPVSSDYIVTPVKNAEMMMQIENLSVSDVWPVAFGQTQGDQTTGAQSGPLLVPFWYKTSTSVMPTPPSYHSKLPIDQNVLNFHFDGQPTPEAIIEATRLKVMGLQYTSQFTVTENFSSQIEESQAGIADWGTDILTSVKSRTLCNFTTGSEIITTIYIGTNFMTSGLPTLTQEQLQVTVSTAEPVTGSEINRFTYLRCMAFDWHPFIYSYQMLYNTNTPDTDQKNSTVFVNAFGDFDNYTTMNKAELRKMHDAALYSLFGIPQTGYNHKYLE